MKRVICMSLAIMMILPACQNVEINNKVEFKNEVELTRATNSLSSTVDDGIIRLKDANDKKNMQNDEDEIRNLINRFEGNFSQALSNGDFSLIRDNIKSDSKLKDAIVMMVKHYSNENIKQRLVSYEINNIQTLKGEEKYRVNIQEKLDIKYPGTVYYVYDFYWTVDIEKIDRDFVISDIVEWVEGEAIYKSKAIKIKELSLEDKSKVVEQRVNKRLPKVLPKYVKDEKTAMIKVAMEGVKEYISVDYKNLDIESKEIGVGFSQGNGLLNLFKNHKEFISEIKEKKIVRRVSMVEMKYQEYYDEYGFVDILVKYSNEEAAVVKEEKKQLRAYMTNIGNGIWYIQNIENVKIN